jgi:hypothetical protein
LKASKWVALGALAALWSVAAPAGAKSKDFCVTDSFGGAIKLRKVASLKKPGSMVALHGLLISLATARGIDGPDGGGEGEGPPPSFSAPVVGTAVTLTEETVQVGVFILGTGNPADSETGSVSLITDQELNGTGAADLEGDYVQDEAYTWTAADCDTLPFP